MSSGRLIFFDTTNYADFPIGGQLTSVRSQLRFIAEKHPEKLDRILLVGVTTRPEEVGALQEIVISDRRFRFLPVTAADTDLSHPGKSLRAAFAKGILSCRKKLGLRRDDLCYIQTPEAMGPLKLIRPGVRCAVFSHGSYGNLYRGVRFLGGIKAVGFLINAYLSWVIRRADLVFVLDSAAFDEYRKLTGKLVKAGNSVVLPDSWPAWEPKEYGGRFLFAGRVSKDKGLEGILQAVSEMEGAVLTVVGDGEALDNCRNSEASRRLLKEKRVRYAGAVRPDEVGRFMDEADILVMNSAFEGIPMTILEALAHGLPVISTPVGGIPEVLDFGKNAESTDGTPESIRKAAALIERDYPSYARSAHDSAARYSYQTVNQEIYEELCRIWEQ